MRRSMSPYMMHPLHTDIEGIISSFLNPAERIAFAMRSRASFRRGGKHLISTLTDAASSSLDLFRYMTKGLHPWSRPLINAAICSGNAEVIEWLKQMGASIYPSADLIRRQFNRAPPLVIHRSSSRRERRLMVRERKRSKERMREACRMGNLPLIRWMYREGVPFGREEARSAVIYGRLGILKWITSQQGADWYHIELFIDAATRGLIHLLEWFISMGWEVPASLTDGPIGDDEEIIDIPCNTWRWLRACGIEVINTW